MWRKFNPKHVWTWIDTRTLTLQEFIDWDDFVTRTNIENKIEYQKVFDYLYALYGNLYAKQNTISLLGNTLRFYIENEVEKQDKQNEIWDNQIDKLLGSYEEIRQFSIGELQPNDVKDKDFDNYLSAKQSSIKEQDILDKIQRLQLMKTPFESVIAIIKEKLFIPHQKGKDEIKVVL